MAKRKRGRGPSPARPWAEMRPATPTPSVALAAHLAERGLDAAPEMWMNDIYTVVVHRYDNGDVHALSIRRNDRRAPRDWRHFQRIKNELAGPEVEAVEIYPAESRLVDTANQFWLWCLREGEAFPLGFAERDVADTIPDDEPAAASSRQRPREEHDVLTDDEIEELDEPERSEVILEQLETEREDAAVRRWEEDTGR